MYLLDSNAIIQYLKVSLPSEGMNFLNNVVDEECNISIISKMETLGFNFKTIEEQGVMENFINGSTIYGINDEVVNKTISIRKIKKIDLPDAIIAATAIEYNFTLITRNINDFQNIEGLKLLNPFDLGKWKLLICEN